MWNNSSFHLHFSLLVISLISIFLSKFCQFAINYELFNRSNNSSRDLLVFCFETIFNDEFCLLGCWEGRAIRVTMDLPEIIFIS